MKTGLYLLLVAVFILSGCSGASNYEMGTSGSDVDGKMIDQVRVTVKLFPPGYKRVGEMTLTGDISGFSFGGQELWIDDYCFFSESK